MLVDAEPERGDEKYYHYAYTSPPKASGGGKRNKDKRNQGIDFPAMPPVPQPQRRPAPPAPKAPEPELLSFEPENGAPAPVDLGADVVSLGAPQPPPESAEQTQPRDH